MAWRRHTRNLTKEVFYDGTTIDGSRLEKAVGEVVDGINNVKKGNTKQRFVTTQYHAGFNPTPRRTSTAANTATWPWLELANRVGSVFGPKPCDAPYNPMRCKGTGVPGIVAFDGTLSGQGAQYAWTRTFYLSRPAILYGVSVLMHVDGGADATRPYSGTINPATIPAYTYNISAGGAPPHGYFSVDGTVDVPIVLDVMNPSTPEDAEMTDVAYTRTRWEITSEKTSFQEPNSTSTGWDDMLPHYDSGQLTDVRPLCGRIVEHRDLNIPVHQRGRVRLAIALPKYDGSTVTAGSWGTIPWFLQGWSVTLTFLEEVQGL